MGAVLAILAIVLISGCGDGSGSDAELTKAEFIERSNAVCSQTRKRIEAEFTAYGESDTARKAERAQRANELTAEKANDAAAEVAERILIPAMWRQLEELRDLGLPDGDEEQAKAMLDALEEGIAKAEARPERAARDGTEAFGKLRRLAETYGIENC